MDPINVQRQGEMQNAEIIRRVTRPVDPLLGELLPGISNEVTLKYIAPRLPRRAYENLAIDPDWQRAFEGRMIYDARVRTQATQEFLLVSCNFLTNVCHGEFPVHCIGKKKFSLFSPSEKRWYKVSPIPGCHEGVLHNYVQAILDGSVYLLAGTRSRKTIEIPSAEVIVLDLARHPLEWRQCANMQVARLDPKVCVMHGKIFVFGGVASSGNFRFEVQNEVYDPMVDTWSFIAPPTPLVSISHAFSLGPRLLVCIGSRRLHPLDEFSDIDNDTKFVVLVDDRGPKIRITTDDDAEDDMDGLHEIIEKELSDGLLVPCHWSPANVPASLIIASRQRTVASFFGFYDPVIDQWKPFNRAALRTALLDEHRPKYMINLRQEDDGPKPGDDGSAEDDDGPDPEDIVTASVWSIYL